MYKKILPLCYVFHLLSMDNTEEIKTKIKTHMKQHAVFVQTTIKNNGKQSTQSTFKCPCDTTINFRSHTQLIQHMTKKKKLMIHANMLCLECGNPLMSNNTQPTPTTITNTPDTTDNLHIKNYRIKIHNPVIRNIALEHFKRHNDFFTIIYRKKPSTAPGKEGDIIKQNNIMCYCNKTFASQENLARHIATKNHIICKKCGVDIRNKELYIIPTIPDNAEDAIA